MFRISHWWLILLLHECCFTQSMTDCLRPACTHLLPLFLTLYTFFLRFTHFFLKYTLPHSQWDPKWGKHCSLFHLKIFLTHSYSWMIVCVLVAQSCLTLYDTMDCSPSGSSVHGINTGVGCHFLLQGIFSTQGSNLHLLHCRWSPARRPVLHCWATSEAPHILEVGSN